MKTRAELIAAEKRYISAAIFSGPRSCDRCRQVKPRAGGVQQPGKRPGRAGPWWCATCSGGTSSEQQR